MSRDSIRHRTADHFDEQHLIGGSGRRYGGRAATPGVVAVARSGCGRSGRCGRRGVGCPSRMAGPRRVAVTASLIAIPGRGRSGWDCGVRSGGGADGARRCSDPATGRPTSCDGGDTRHRRPGRGHRTRLPCVGDDRHGRVGHNHLRQPHRRPAQLACSRPQQRRPTTLPALESSEILDLAAARPLLPHGRKDDWGSAMAHRAQQRTVKHRRDDLAVRHVWWAWRLILLAAAAAVAAWTGHEVTWTWVLDRAAAAVVLAGLVLPVVVIRPSRRLRSLTRHPGHQRPGLHRTDRTGRCWKQGKARR